MRFFDISRAVREDLFRILDSHFVYLTDSEKGLVGFSVDCYCYNFYYFYSFDYSKEFLINLVINRKYCDQNLMLKIKNL